MKLRPEEAKVVARAVLRMAGQARRNPARFYDLVVREETSRARLATLPHQELVFKFVLHFERCVIRMPVGFSKTYLMAALSMWLMGLDPTLRGAIVSASQGQAQKPLAMVRDYIEDSKELQLVFPNLKRSSRRSDAWTQSRLTVERPRGIRDPTLTAVGVHGKLPGSRLSWLLVDDILSEENTSTPEQRETVSKWFLSTVLSRRDVSGSRVVVTNTPWHPEDLTYRLEKQGWPTLTMDAWGNVHLTNTHPEDMIDGTEFPRGYAEFDCDDIRPSEADPKEKAFRLTAHDSPVYDPELRHLPVKDRIASGKAWVDEADEVYLWPEKFGPAEMERLAQDYAGAMHEFHQLYSMKCRDEDSARVKVEHIDTCKKLARDNGVFSYTSEWREGRTYTGVDLAVGQTRKHDRSSIFTFGLMPDKTRRILRIDSGRWFGPELVDRIIEHHESFGSIVSVENNAAQDYIRQFVLDRDRSVPIRAHRTGSNKHSRQHGIDAIFVEVTNGAWLFPNDPTGKVPESMQRLVDAILYHDPKRHTGDELMSMWIAWYAASERGVLRRRGGKPGPGSGGPSIGSR